MGCDGGTIPRRDEMVKLKKKAEKADRDAELAAKWKYCALSGEELRQPVVACELGRLYNKESLLMALLDKSSMPEVARHIRSLKDVVELKLTINPSYRPSDRAAAYNGVQAAEFVCPVSGLEMSGRYRFVYLRVCGCVFAEKALKEVPSHNCHKCGRPFTVDEVVVLNGTEEETKKQRETMEERRRAARMAKRKRKAESLPEESTASVPTASDTTKNEKDSPPIEKRQKLTPASVGKTSVKGGAKGKGPSRGAVGSSKLNAASTASSVVKRATEEVNSYNTVAEDPSAREVYKSLFNSGATERPQERSAHWVTFFPYH